MLEVTLTEVQNYLGLPVQADVRMQSILDGVNEKVESNVGDLSLGEKTMTVNNRAVKNSTFTLDIIEPTDVTEINGNDFSTKVNGTDYLIKSDGDVIIKDLCSYTANDFGYFEVKFNAGYEFAPKQLISVVSEYVGYLYSLDLGKDVLEEKLGPRGVKYQENNSDLSNPALKRFKNGLSRFIPLALKVY